MSDSDRPSRPSRSQDGRGRHARSDSPTTGDGNGRQHGGSNTSPDNHNVGAVNRAPRSLTSPRSVGPQDHRQLGPTPVKIVLSLVAILLLVGGGYAYSTIGQLAGNLSHTDGLNLGKQSDGAVDILLVGVDSREDAKGNPLSQEEIDMLRAGEEEATNTDTMILIRIPDDGSSATAVSLPRDTYVNGGDQLGNTKLNGVYGLTKNYFEEARHEEAAMNGVDPNMEEIRKESTQAGREALINAVNDLTGISVDHYAEVGLLGFVLLTDAVGGVDVCLNNAVNEPLSGANFPAGEQTLNGPDALSFVRQRHDLPRGDLDRITRQQAYLASLANKILSARTLSNPGQLSKLNGAVSRSLTIDSNWDIMGLATQMQNLSGGNVTFQTIPVTSIDGTGDNGESVVTVDKNQVHAFFENLVTAEAAKESSTNDESIPDYDPAASTVSILNASSVDGLATRVSDLVAGAGFSMGDVGNHAESGVSESQVNVADTSDPAARDLAKKLGGLTVVEDPSLAPGQISVTLSGAYSGPGATADDTRTLNGNSTGNGLNVAPSPDSVGTPGTPDSEAAESAPISAGSSGPMCVN